MAYRPKEKILTASQLCQWWDITPDQLDKLRREKDLPNIELLRGTYIFTEKSLAEWAEQHLNSPLKAPKSTRKTAKAP